MSFDLKAFSSQTGRVTICVRHVTPGRGGTTMDTDIELHLSPSVIEPGQRVSVLSMDLRWVVGATVPATAIELARVLERLACGLREGPGGHLALLTTTQPAPVEDPTDAP